MGNPVTIDKQGLKSSGFKPLLSSAILVHINFQKEDSREDIQEFQELVNSAGAAAFELITASKHKPDAKYFVGKGKAEEIAAAVQLHQADLVIFNHALTPAQERNLERLVKCRVIDRIRLILDIFAQRARTFEGKLQVELAQLRHLSTRLVRGWTHLERQKGGIGLRGPGETQLEVDRRLIKDRIRAINERLEKVRKQREQSRRARKRAALPTIALVGYTNAGKSTLFNCLTQAEVYVADQLFATLDPTLRRLELPELGPVVLADTVGFIRHLPHELVQAFRATLEEVQTADLLLHVVDASNDARNAQIQQVQDVLTQINANQIPQLLVYNKIDLLNDVTPYIEPNRQLQVERVWLSAKTGAGMELLSHAIVSHLYHDRVMRQLCLKPEQGKLRANLYALDGVIDETIDEFGHCQLTIQLSKMDFAKLFGES